MKKEKKRNHKLHVPEYYVSERLSMNKVEWKPNLAKEKRSTWMKGVRLKRSRETYFSERNEWMNAWNRQNETETNKILYNSSSKFLDRENINLCYSIRHCVTHYIVYPFYSLHSLFLSTSKKCQFLIYVSFSSQLYGFTESTKNI